jgi:hypothetical protein
VISDRFFDPHPVVSKNPRRQKLGCLKSLTQIELFMGGENPYELAWKRGKTGEK